MKLYGQALAFLLLTQVSAFGKAAYFSEEQLVLKSAAIAIIDLDTPSPIPLANPFDPTVKSAPNRMPCTTSAQAKCVELISGELPATFVMQGDETFICAQCRLSKGRYLAFLVKVDDHWEGTNWQLSLRPVKDGKIEWYSKPDQAFSLAFQDSNAVLTRIRAILAAKKAVNS
jgi:hypothetical protein